MASDERTSAAATNAERLLEAKDRVARIAVATHDRPAIQRLAREALELLHRVKT